MTTNLFAYNLRSELTTAHMSTNLYAYTYDPIGNRLSATENGATTLYAANELNQYTNALAGGRAPTYDLDGNMTSDGEHHFTWDAENRLVGVSPRVLITGSRTYSYEYDHMGRRIGKTVNGVHSSFVYDGWSLLRETTGTNTTHYVWGADVSQRMQGAGDIGGLLCVRVDGTPYYPCADGNGNIVGFVDGTGATVARREYSPFGETAAETGPAPAGLRIWFSSKYLDEETGLYYYGYRYYHPGLGRWLSRDPLEELDSGNLYAFALNMPTFAVDLYGLKCQKWNPADFSSGGDVDMTLKWWNINSDLSFNFGVSGEMCDKCCDDGSVDYEYSVEASLGVSLAFATMTWGGGVDLGGGLRGGGVVGHQGRNSRFCKSWSKSDI